MARRADPDLVTTAGGYAERLGLPPRVPARPGSCAQVGRRRQQACRPYQPALRRRPPSLSSSSTCCPSLGTTHTVYSLSQRCTEAIDGPAEKRTATAPRDSHPAACRSCRYSAPSVASGSITSMPPGRDSARRMVCHTSPPVGIVPPRHSITRSCFTPRRSANSSHDKPYEL